jgi:transcriptional regulator NrdR family protein
MRERVRSLEQKESAEIRRLQCATCGQRWFESLEQLQRHQLVCLRTETLRTSRQAAGSDRLC